MSAVITRVAQAGSGGELAIREWLEALPGSTYGLLALGSAILLVVLCMAAFAAAAGILRFRNRRKEREWLAREQKWEIPLLEVLAGMMTPAALWDLIEPGEELYFVDYLMRFARRTRGSTRNVIEELARPYLGPVVARLDGGDAERRARAVETVALLGFGPYVGRMLAALRDPSPLVSMIAARSIANQQRPEHVEVLLADAARLSNWSPRQLTAVLTSMGSAAIPSLRKALTDRRLPPALRAVAADSLRQLHDPYGMDAAEQVLAAETDRDVLAATLRLVADLGQPEQAVCVRAFAAHEDPVIRAAALHALTTVGDASDLELLRNGIEDESGWVAIQAARALKQTGSAASLRDLARGHEPRSLLAQQVLLESA